jgi:2-polyprenyl-3-methyl-5-hydroxy-6-metoxy-1,4-benzoquinol methylase
MNIERFDVIREVCRGKYCLDVGLVGDLDHHLREPAKWVFHHVRTVARRAVGMDIDGNALARVHQDSPGLLVCGDAERFAFRDRFEVIIGGEIIEHLSNPGAFLECCRGSLTPDGVLVLTTPNTFSVNNVLKALLFGHVQLYQEHVNAYTESLLCELLRRHGFTATRIMHVTESNRGIKNKVFRFLSWLRPRWSETLVVIARLRLETAGTAF